MNIRLIIQNREPIDLERDFERAPGALLDSDSGSFFTYSHSVGSGNNTVFVYRQPTVEEL